METKVEDQTLASETPTPEPRPKRRPGWPLALAVIMASLVAYNLTVWAPVATVLGRDDRNAVASIHVYRTWLIHPRDITVDLVAADGAATIDLTRALFQAAEALRDREFGRVILARQGKPVFMMEGAAFAQLGQEYSSGQNPVYLIRTLPEQLYLPDGTAAFGSWTGGWLGVFGRQIEDVNSFGQAWMTGKHSTDTAIAVS